MYSLELVAFVMKSDVDLSHMTFSKREKESISKSQEIFKKVMQSKWNIPHNI